MPDLITDLDIELPVTDERPPDTPIWIWMLNSRHFYVLLWLTRGCCWYCGNQLGNSDETIDHVHPTSKAGYNMLNNMVPACRRCNSMKGKKHIDEFREYLHRRGKLPRETEVIFWAEARGLELPLVQHFKPEQWTWQSPKIG